MDRSTGNKKAGSWFKHRFPQLLLSSSCSSTAASAAASAKLTKLSIPHCQELEQYQHCRHKAGHRRKLDQSSLIAAAGTPVVQITIDCGGFGGGRSFHSSEPLLPLRLRAAKDDHKKKGRRVADDGDSGRKCPAAPQSSLSGNYYYYNYRRETKSKKKPFERKFESKRKERMKLQPNAYGFSSSSSFDSGREFDLFSCDEEEEEEEESATLFSSKSFTSDSSEFYRSNRKKKKKKKNRSKSMKSTRRPPRRGSNQLRPLLSFSPTSTEKKEKTAAEAEPATIVAAGFAVVKNSNDPYMDFRSSMAEMIVERRIKSGKELDRLLDSYLLLNSASHHPVILEAFADIWEAIFCLD